MMRINLNLFWFMVYSSFVSIFVIKYNDQNERGREGLTWLILAGDSPPLREIRAGTKGKS